jgi:hypothetical protein
MNGQGDLGVIIALNHPLGFMKNHPTLKIYTSQSAPTEEVFSDAREAGSAFTAADFALAYILISGRPCGLSAGSSRFDSLRSSQYLCFYKHTNWISDSGHL